MLNGCLISWAIEAASRLTFSLPLMAAKACSSFLRMVGLGD